MSVLAAIGRTWFTAIGSTKVGESNLAVGGHDDVVNWYVSYSFAAGERMVTFTRATGIEATLILEDGRKRESNREKIKKKVRIDAL